MRYNALLALAFFTCAGSQAAERPRILASDLSLGGIAIGQHESSVVKHLGKPITRSFTGEGYKLTYKGMEVYVGVGSYGVFDLISTNPAYCTPSHVCPGMPVANLVSKFGPAVEAVRENGKFLEYIPSESTCWLQVSESVGIIKSLRIACQP